MAAVAQAILFAVISIAFVATGTVRILATVSRRHRGPRWYWFASCLFYFSTAGLFAATLRPLLKNFAVAEKADQSDLYAVARSRAERASSDFQVAARVELFRSDQRMWDADRHVQVAWRRDFFVLNAEGTCVVVLAAFLFTRPLFRRRLESSRAKQGRCRRCGYDLRATTGICPECVLPNPDSK